MFRAVLAFWVRLVLRRRRSEPRSTRVADVFPSRVGRGAHRQLMRRKGSTKLSCMCCTRSLFHIPPYTIRIRRVSYSSFAQFANPTTASTNPCVSSQRWNPSFQCITHPQPHRHRPPTTASCGSHHQHPLQPTQPRVRHRPHHPNSMRIDGAPTTASIGTTQHPLQPTNPAMGEEPPASPASPKLNTFIKIMVHIDETRVFRPGRRHVLGYTLSL